MHSTSPYLTVSTEALWRKTMDGVTIASIDPHLNTTLRITPEHKIASAGSCFAQRISQALRESGYNYLVLEKGPEFLSQEMLREQGYGVYSARYGNIYTALQLLQTFRRAFGSFTPAEPLWKNALGRVVDPFRSGIEPMGFFSEEECLWDRESHLNATRQVFEELDILIFTLGLTESWHSKEDGAVFPNCPGSGLGGEFDPARHVFHNFSVAEVVAHMESFMHALHEVNPRAQVILTVSPVPLMATFEPRHVLQSTVYSKAVLRVACEELVRRNAQMHYFSSYEIVTATGDTKSYFKPNRRDVTDAAVAHVIQCFHRQFMGAAGALPIKQATASQPAQAKPAEAMCDEEKVMAALAEQMYQR